MFYLIIISSILTTAFADFSDVHKKCIAENSAESSSDFLLGHWYMLYKFIPSVLIPSVSCVNVTFTKPTADEILEYQEKYKSSGFPFTLDENPLLVNRYDKYKGMISGKTQAKFYVLEPKSAMRINNGYEVRVYRPINDKYVLFWDCALRGYLRWLMSREKNPPDEEISQVLSSIPDVQRMYPRRHCTD